MQPRPSATDLLAGISRSCSEELSPRLSGNARRTVLVIAGLAEVLTRELELAAGADAAERAALGGLLGHEGDLVDLRRALVSRLQAGSGEEFEHDAHRVLVETTKNDLAISKPGYELWAGP